MTLHRDACKLARLAPLGTAALLVAGCVEEAQIPSEFAGSPSLDPQTGVAVMPRGVDVLVEWQLPPDSAWAAYQKWTLPSALDQAYGVRQLPDIGTLDSVRRARVAAIHLAEAGLPSGAMWIVDLPGAASVAFGSQLSRLSEQSVAVVPTFNNWPADHALVPAEDTLAAMIAMPPREVHPGASTSVPLFLLDSWRLAYKDQAVEDTVIDNRYMLTPGDFPSPEVLRAQGISRVVYVVKDRRLAANEEDDLNELFQSYGNAGIEIDLVDLAWFGEEPDAGGTVWWPFFDGCRLFVTPRATVVGDARFYARARSGFGGVHARPMVLAHGFTDGGGWGHSVGGGG